MSLALQLTIFNHNSMMIVGTFPLLNYDIQMDALSNVSSTLVIDDKAAIENGDYLAVRPLNSTIMLYYGQITTLDHDESSDTLSITANYIWNILNGDIVVSNKTGNSYETHVAKLIQNYNLSNSTVNLFQYAFSHSTNTPFSISNTDGISTSNFIDYLIRGFKLHNTIIEVTGIGQDNRNGQPFYYPKIDFHQIVDKWNFNNKIYDFTDWVVTDSRHLRNYNNELWIVDQSSRDMENPSVLARYWLQEDGSVTKTMTSNVVQPTQVQIYLYDKTATDNPSYDNIASSNLQANTYSHNIQFSMPIDNNFMPLNKVKLGLQSNIYYNQTLYKSVLSAYSLNSDSDTISLTFGNLRFGKTDLFSTDS